MCLLGQGSCIETDLLRRYIKLRYRSRQCMVDKPLSSEFSSSPGSSLFGRNRFDGRAFGWIMSYCCIAWKLFGKRALKGVVDDSLGESELVSQSQSS